MSMSPSYKSSPPIQGIRRSFTPGNRALSIHEKAGLEDTDAAAQVFYSHPNAKIIAFTPPQESVRSHKKEQIPVDTDYPVDTIETLPWRSRTESSQAAGKLIIEKVRGSSVFLKCQEVSRAILRNTQCWCVDGQSKFVIRIRAFKYWRIELPTQTEEDRQKVEELKKVLSKVLKYETTPCPFIRAFTVSLPDDAIVPRRKGTWKRRDSSQTGLSDSEAAPRGSYPDRNRPGIRSPPTSYPKNGPSYDSLPRGSQPRSSSGIYHDSLHEDGETPAVTEPLNDLSGNDSDNESEASNRDHPDHDLDGVQGQKDTRGRPQASRQTSATIPVSIRVASIERSKDHRIPRPNPDKPARSTQARTLARTSIPAVTIGTGSETMASEVRKSTPPPEPSSQQPEESPQSNGHGESPPQEELTGPFESGSATEDPVKFAEVLSDQSTAEAQPDPERVQNDVLSAESQGTKLEQMSVADTTPEILSEQAIDAVGVESTTSDENLDSSRVAETDDIELPSDIMLSETQSAAQEQSLLDRPEHQTSQQATPDDLPPSDVPSPVDNEAISVRDTSSNQIVHGVKGVDTPEDNKAEDVRSDLEDDDDTVSVVSSADSFHTLSSNLQRTDSDVDHDFDRTPTNPRLGLVTGTAWPHRRELSELTVTASSSPSENFDIDESFEQAEELLGTQGDPESLSSSTHTLTATTTQIPDIGVRQRLRARRSFSPMPPSSIIITNPNAQQQQQHHREMAKAILQTVVVKPLEFAIFIIHIARLVVQGATMNDLLSGDLFRSVEQHRQQVTGLTNQRNGSAHSRAENNNEDQTDDFNVPIRGRARNTSHTSATAAASADHDRGRRHRDEHHQHLRPPQPQP